MPGMNSGLTDNNATLVAAFKAALLHQGLIVLAVLAVLALGWVSVREWAPAAKSAFAGKAAAVVSAEPAGRRLLRIGFGILWLFDGILQAQPAMAAGLSSQVIEPSAATSPGWVQHLVNWAGTTWSYHPVQAGAAAVWIQVGIGAWLIAAPSGRPARLAGLVSVGWGLIVWAFGESFGGIFAPGLSFLFGAPGAVLFYCVAGALIALPDKYWRSSRLGSQMLAGLGLFFVAMAVLQAWPGRGFWQGAAHGKLGPLASMLTSMAQTPQPRFLAGWLNAFQSFDASHGFAVNLLVVIALGVAGGCLLSRQPRLIRPALVLTAILCLATWVLVQDLGFFGGLGTDPNSMISIALLVAAGYVAMTRLPAPAPESVPDNAAEPEPSRSVDPEPSAESEPSPRAGRPVRPRRPAVLAHSFAAISVRAVLAIWAAAIVLVGAAPMVMAQASSNADPIIAQAIDGNAAPLNFAAPAFTLTDQDGHQVSLASLHGKTVLLTFLDPVCTSDCPLIAQEFRVADRLLGASSARVELVAVVANPIYRSLAYTRAFDRQEGLSGLPNWLFLTGSLPQLQQAWKNYAISAQILPAGGMIGHSDIAYVIDANGRTRTELNFDPGPGTASSVSSFAVELSDAAQNVMRST
jgi:cytochrome oxidase Cu insertion factor (SCO1/SenC/PrrC family)